MMRLLAETGRRAVRVALALYKSHVLRVCDVVSVGETHYQKCGVTSDLV